MNQHPGALPFVGQIRAVGLFGAWALPRRLLPMAAAGWALLLLLGGQPAQAGTTEITLLPAQDNSIFEEGELSNGAGAYLFTGRTLIGARRRALIRFDLGSIPAGATIEAARLELSMSRTISGTLTVRLHRLLRGWGEGTVDAPGQEGTGAPAQAGDATWTQNRLGGGSWDQLGGDYETMASAAAPVRNLGRYTWTSDQLIADVQAWLDDPASNFGWIVIGNEAAGFGTAKRLDSRENPDPAARPVLVVSYSGGVVPAPVAIPVIGIPGLLVLVSLLLVTAVTGWDRSAGRRSREQTGGL